MKNMLLPILLAISSAASAAPPLPASSVMQLADSFTNQDGKSFSLASRRGRPQVVAMFYTSCQFICPLIIESAKGVDHALTPAERANLQVLLISIDPARDTPAVLKTVSAQRKVDTSRWTLARTNESGVRKTAALLGVRYRKLEDGEFNHTSALILLDADGRVLGRTEKLGAVPDPQFIAAVRKATAARATQAR